MLSDRFGEVILYLDAGDFKHSQYYKEEMGDHLSRQFIAIKPPFHEELLPEAKRFARTLEWRFCRESNKDKIHRRINIDPGFVSLSKVVLSTSKNYSHRIYLADGVYAEVTLIFRDRVWKTLEWTYPDYTTQQVKQFLLNCRMILKQYIDALPGIGPTAC